MYTFHQFLSSVIEEMLVFTLQYVFSVSYVILCIYSLVHIAINNAFHEILLKLLKHSPINKFLAKWKPPVQFKIGQNDKSPLNCSKFFSFKHLPYLLSCNK